MALMVCCPRAEQVVVLIAAPKPPPALEVAAAVRVWDYLDISRYQDTLFPGRKREFGHIFLQSPAGCLSSAAMTV